MNADPPNCEKLVTCPPLVGPRIEFKPLHQINPLRLDWIDANASTPAEGRRYRLRRRYPGRIHTPGRPGHRVDLSEKAPRRRLAAPLRAASRWITATSPPKTLPANARPASGCRNLHGNARTRPDPASTIFGACATLVTAR